MTGLLAVDVGNTQTALGLFEGGELTKRWRLATEPQRTGDELCDAFPARRLGHRAGVDDE